MGSADICSAGFKLLLLSLTLSLSLELCKGDAKEGGGIATSTLKKVCFCVTVLLRCTKQSFHLVFLDFDGV